MKKIIFVLSLAFLGCLFFNVSHAEAATLYWCNTNDANWTTAGNWFTDVGCNTPGPMPEGWDDAVIIVGVVAPTVDLDSSSWSAPASVDASSSGIIFTSSALFPTVNSFSGTLTGNATFGGTSANMGTITGNVTFNNSSFNNSNGNVIGTATFKDSSMNWNGTVTGNAFFDALTHNHGVVTGIAKYTNAVGGVITIPDGGEWSDGTSSSNVGNDNVVITDGIFDGYGFNNGTLTGDATFNDLSVNWGTVNGIAKFTYATGGVITISDGEFWGSGTAGSNVDVDGNPITSWIFTGTGENDGTITVGATFYGDLSENWGDISGTKTRYYTASTTDDSRDFLSDGAWTVIADGAGVVVNLTGSDYDETTTFKTKNGGSFIPASPNDITPEVLPPDASSDSSLSALSVSEGTLTPTFATGTLSYTDSVANSITSLNVTATKTDADATMTIGGTSATNGVPVSKSLSVGDNTINIIVTAEDTTTSTYAIVVTRVAAARGSSGGFYVRPPVTIPPNRPACQSGDKFSSTTGLPCPLPTICPVGHLFSVVTGLPCTSHPTIPIPPLTCSIAHTLRLGSRGDEVKCLQTGLSISPDGIFGPITKTAVIVFQKSKNLLPDGVFGPKSRAVWASIGR